MSCNKNEQLKCRTCFEECEIFHSLDEPVDLQEFPDKSLYTLLQDIAKIETKPELIDLLPKYICDICVQKVKNAYAFVLQAQQVNRKLLATIRAHNEVKPDCLSEAPIDIPSNTVEVRIEIDENGLQTHYDETSLYHALEAEANVLVKEDPIIVIETHCLKSIHPRSPEQNDAMELICDEDDGADDSNNGDHFMCDECGSSFAWRRDLLRHMKFHCEQPTYGCSLCSRKFVRKDKLKEHLKIHEKSVKSKRLMQRQLKMQLQLQDTDDKESTKDDEFKCDQCGKAFNTLRDLSRHRRTHLPESEKFNCPYCDRKFNRKDNMKTHMKKHNALIGSTKKSRFHSKSKKVKGVDPNLCKANGCKVIQCMICLSKHSKISDLRTHLPTHQHMTSLPQRNLAIEEVSLQLYPEEQQIATEEELVARITSDIRAKELHRFYSITNEVGYELSLSSSETGSDSDDELEVEGEENNDVKKSISHKYTCSLCNLSFPRKYKFFQHQMWAHEWDEAAYICVYCKSRFLSKELLQEHHAKQCKNTNKRFNCKKCPRRFMWMGNFKTHMLMMHAEVDDSSKPSMPQTRTFVCLECNCCFLMEKDLTRHMLMHRSDKFIFKCLWCARKFYHRSNLLMHVRLHGVTPETFDAEECIITATRGPNGAKEINCRVCNLRFDRIATLRQHLLENHKSDNLEQTVTDIQHFDSLLNYSIVNELGLELDLNDSETDGEYGYTQYTCELCHIRCKRKYEMAQHQRSVHKHEQVPLACDKCVFRTVSKDILAHHKRTQCYNEDKQFQCNSCPYKFMWPENLQNHTKLLHPNKPTSVQSKDQVMEGTTEKEFQCGKCGKKYSRKNWLLTHIQKMHPEDSSLDVPPNDTLRLGLLHTPAAVENKIPKEKKFLCTFCGRGVSSSSSLIIHMRRHTGEKPFKCDFCDMAFPRSSDLMGHRRKHTGERPHVCTVCNKAFARLYKLKTHMRIHSGEKPYKCTYCEKSFAQSNDLTLHVRRHTGELPYVCGICGERFIQSTALKNHRIMRGHFEEPETLKIEAI